MLEPKNTEAETIYKIIPAQYTPPAKKEIYKSKYPSDLAPTGSTLINHTTSRPGVANLGGDYKLIKGPHCHTDYYSTIGRAIGSQRPLTSEYRRKTTGTMGSNKLPERSIFEYPDSDSRKPKIPPRDEVPILGQQSHKNYVLINAVENILSIPKVLKEPENFLKKKDFGKVPEYLAKNKEHLQVEHKMMQNLHEQEMDRQSHMLTQEEAQQLRDGLKAKWNTINREYQSITHIRKVTTVGLQRKKDTCEKALAQIEKDLDKINKRYIFVDSDK